MAKRDLVSSDRKNLHRLAGEFLVASRLAQRGYMTSLQWGVTTGYDLLVFDKAGNVAFLEVKSCAAKSREWVVQKKYANPTDDKIPAEQRFVCFVNLCVQEGEPEVFVLPSPILAKGLRYYFNDRFPNSTAYHLALDRNPQGKTKLPDVKTVGQYIGAKSYLDNYSRLGVQPIVK